MTLAHFQRTFTDTAGNVQPSLEVTIRNESTGAIAAIFTDSAGTTPKDNPFTTDSFGYGDFYAADGRYRIQATGIDWRNEEVITFENIAAAVQDAEDAAQAAALNAGIYADTAEGLANTVDGDYFSTPAAGAEEYLTLYRNDAGVATEIDTYPNKTAIDNVRIDLASNLSTEGSDLVAHTGTSDTVTEALDKRTIYVGSVADLEELSLPVGANVRLTESGRYGEGVIKTGTPPSDPQKGIYIVIANGNYWERDEKVNLTPEMFGVTAAESTTGWQAAADMASSLGAFLWFSDDYIVSSLTPTGPLKFRGSGSLTKLAGTTGHLINTAFNLDIRGDITIDQNRANNPNGSATATSDTAITHSGAKLILDGISLPSAVSSCVRTSASEIVSVKNCDIQNGWINFYANVPTTTKVTIKDNVISNSHRDDGLQVLGGSDVAISGNTCNSNGRSGIVTSAAANRCRIYGNTCSNNKIEIATSQGGWGIVCSVSVYDSVVSGNTCSENERGGVTIDTYTASAATDAWIVVANNVINAFLSGGGSSTTGISVNGARYCNVSGNRIRGAGQGMLCVDADQLNVYGNAIEDCSSFFIQISSCVGANVSANIFDGCTIASNAAVQLLDSSGFSVTGNKISGLSGSGQHVFWVRNGDDFFISGNHSTKIDTGTGWCFRITGTQYGILKGNQFVSEVSDAWQYYINATGSTITKLVTEYNDVICPSLTFSPNRYVLSGASTIGDGDTLNNIKDLFPSAPTAWTFKTGYTAINGGVAQYWDGAAWVSI